MTQLPVVELDRREFITIPPGIGYRRLCPALVAALELCKVIQPKCR